MIISDWLSSPMFGGEFIFLALVVSALLILVLVKSDQNGVTLWIPLALGILGLYVMASGFALITTWPSSLMASSSSPLAKIISFWPYFQIIYGVALVYIGFQAFSLLMLVATFLFMPSGSIIQFFQSDETRLAFQLKAEQYENFLACEEDPVHKAMLARLNEEHRVQTDLEVDRFILELNGATTRFAEKRKYLIDSGKDIGRKYLDAESSEIGAVYDRHEINNKSGARLGQLLDLRIEHERYCLAKTGYSYPL